MAYRKRKPVIPDVTADQSADRVARAYYAAKIANPKLTQKEFARKAMPTIQRRYDAAKNPLERRRVEDSGARYLRLILEGKRTGRVNVEQAARYRAGRGDDLFQVIVTDSKGIKRSFNLVGGGTSSQLDVPLVESALRGNPRAIENRIYAWRERYDIEIELEDIADWEVRRVLQHNKHSEKLVIPGAAGDSIAFPGQV